MRLIYRFCLSFFSLALLAGTAPLATARHVTVQAYSPALVEAPAAPASPGDEFWDPIFALEGVSGPVYAIMVYSTKICIGGDFHQVGSLPAQNIACWDKYSRTWSTFGSGLSGPVYALAYTSDGKVYAGGLFSQAGGVGAQNIARWNPITQAWEDIGGVSGPVYVLLSAGGDYLYVGGQFGQAGQVSALNVARFKYSSQTWSALTHNFANGVSGPVYALAATLVPPNVDIYVGGSFTGIGGVSGVNAYNLAKWNTASIWAGVGGSVSGPVYALTICNGALHVGGKFSQAGALATENIASWNLVTKAWSPLDTGTSNTVEVLGCAHNRLYAGGRFSQAGSTAANNIARWNFTLNKWAALGGGTSGPVFAIAMASSPDGPAFTEDVYIGGLFGGAGTTGSHNFARYTGDYDQSNPEDVNWDIPICTQIGPNNNVKTIAAVGGMLYYGGQFTGVGEIVANHLARYDSQNNTWSAIGAGVDGEVKTIVVSGNYVYVGGAFTTAGGNPIPYLARWNSLYDTWEGFGSGPNGPVYAIAIQGSDVFIGGSFTAAGGVTLNNIARWDSTAQTWGSLGTGVFNGMNGPVNALAFLGNDLYVGGSFGYAQDVQAHYIARWNGSTWSSLGSGMNSHVYVLAVKDSDLYVGGYFSTAGGIPAYSIARWDGAAWHALGNGMGGTITTIAFNQGDVYVGGGFGVGNNNKLFYNAARWDGAEWWPLGSGIYGGGQAMAVGARGIYIGGTSLMNGLRCNGNMLWQTPTSPAGIGSISGQVHGPGGVPVPGAIVQACLQGGASTCTVVDTTDVNGNYQAGSLSDGEYIIKIYPPQGASSLPTTSSTLVISGGNALQQDLDLASIAPLPALISLSPSRITGTGVPLVNWKQPLLLQAQGCMDGSASYQVFQNGIEIASGALAEDPAGQYSASLNAFYPKFGYMSVSLGLTCPPLSPQAAAFDVFVDPTGTVRTIKGLPIAGAAVTLFAYDPATLSLAQVPAASEILTPANQVNPDLTDSGGHFGWDVAAGTYMIRIEKEGCTSPLVPGRQYVETDLLTSPFDLVDLDLRLQCASDLSFVYLPVVSR